MSHIEMQDTICALHHQMDNEWAPFTARLICRTAIALGLTTPEVLQAFRLLFNHGYLEEEIGRPCEGDQPQRLHVRLTPRALRVVQRRLVPAP